MILLNLITVVVGPSIVNMASQRPLNLNHHSMIVVGNLVYFSFCIELPSPGYFEHRRRDEEDRLIVSHIAWLILKYDCHINVEFSTGVQLFQYLFKYFFKPLDSANWKVTIEHPAENIPRPLGGRKPIDQIRDYERGRYLSSIEAATQPACNRNFFLQSYDFEWCISVNKCSVEANGCGLVGEIEVRRRTFDTDSEHLSLITRS